MGTCMSTLSRAETDSLKHQIAAIRAERDTLKDQLSRIHWHALVESQFMEHFTSEEAKREWRLLDSDLAIITPIRGGSAYHLVDLRNIRERIANEREWLAEIEAQRYGVEYRGTFASVMCTWRTDFSLRSNPKNDHLSMRRVALEGVRSKYLEKTYGIGRNYRGGEMLENPNTVWPAIWPWRVADVLSPDWSWHADDHAYWFGPSFKAEARALVMCLYVLGYESSRIVPFVLTRLARMYV